AVQVPHGHGTRARGHGVLRRDPERTVTVSEKDHDRSVVQAGGGEVELGVTVQIHEGDAVNHVSRLDVTLVLEGSVAVALEERKVHVVVVVAGDEIGYAVGGQIPDDDRVGKSAGGVVFEELEGSVSIPEHDRDRDGAVAGGGDVGPAVAI